MHKKNKNQMEKLESTCHYIQIVYPSLGFAKFSFSKTPLTNLLSRFFDVIWYLLITASTVGYGDYFPVTDLGKVFGVFFISSKEHNK